MRHAHGFLGASPGKLGTTHSTVARLCTRLKFMALTKDLEGKPEYIVHAAEIRTWLAEPSANLCITHIPLHCYKAQG